MTRVEFERRLRERIWELLFETKRRDVPGHMATAINEMVAAGERITGDMLLTLPFRHMAQGHEHRVLKRIKVPIVVVEDQAYVDVEWEPE